MFCFLGRSSDNYVGIKLDKIRANFFFQISNLCFYSLHNIKNQKYQQKYQHKNVFDPLFNHHTNNILCNHK